MNLINKYGVTVVMDDIIIRHLLILTKELATGN